MIDKSEIDRHNKLYEQACEILHNQMILADDDRSGKHGTQEPISEERILQGVAILDEVTKINPRNWSAYWVMGKAYQTLKQYDQAYHAFKNAQLIARHDPKETYDDILRELALSCLLLGKIEEALYYQETAIKFAPTDATHLSNYAISLIFAGRLDEAEQSAKKAMAALPQDLVAQSALAMVENVRSGDLDIKSITFKEMFEMPERNEHEP